MYFDSYGVVTNDNYLKVSINKKDLNKVTSNTKLKINNKDFAYIINSISEDLNTLNDTVEIIIDINLPDKMKITNNIVNFKILLSEKTIFEYILEKVKV